MLVDPDELSAMNALRQHTSALWFAGPLVAVYATAFGFLEVLPRTSGPGAIAAGLTIDLVVLVPALYYWVMVRGRQWPSITLAPVILLSFGAASFLIPQQHHTVLSAVGFLLPAVELSLVGYVSYRAWRLIRSPASNQENEADFYDRIRKTLRGAFGAPAFAGALAYEVSLFHYALSFRPAVAREDGFSYHHRSGYGAVLGALLMAAALELVGVHLLLRMWSETAVWIHGGLSVYAVLWLLGDYRAMRRRPHQVGHEDIRIRCGLRWDIEASWEEVALVRRSRRPEIQEDYLNAVPLGDPRYIVEFSEPIEAVGPYGITRKIRSVGVLIDDSAAFEQRVRTLGLAFEP